MYAVGLRDSLKNLLTQHYQLTELTKLAELPAHAVNDLVLVDAQSVTTTDLYEHMASARDHKMVYIVDEVTNTIQALATTLKIPTISEDAILDYLQKANNQKKSRPIVTFFGALPSLGTTLITLATATQLQETYDLKVAVLGLNLYDPGSWMVERPVHHLDDIQPILTQRNLPPDNLRDNMYELRSGVKYLFGNRDPLDALEKYKVQDIAYLIDQAEEAFDVVLLDAGSVLNTAAALQSLIASTLLFSVITDRPYIERCFQTIAQHVLKPLEIRASDVLLIGSQMQHPNEKTLAAFAQKLLAQPTKGIFPDETALLFQAEQMGDPLRQYTEHRSMREGLSNLAEIIATTYGYGGAK